MTASAQRQPRDFQSLPVIDIGGLFSSHEDERQAVAERLGDAARNVGFFRVVGHGSSDELRQSLLDQTRHFFEQPREDKMQYYIGLSASNGPPSSQLRARGALSSPGRGQAAQPVAPDPLSVRPRGP